MALMFSVTYNKNDGSGTYLDYSATSKNTLDAITSVGANWGEPGTDWSRSGYTFVEWNTASDGTGTGYQPYDIYSGREVEVYAIWQEDAPTALADISLGNTVIATMYASGSIVLETAGTYLTDDITITLY